MTKTTNYGSQSVTPVNQVTVLTRQNGTVTSLDVGPTASYTRRIGRFSKITSQSGVDSRFRPVTHIQESYTVVPLSALKAVQEGTFSPPTNSFVTSRIYGHLEGIHKKRYGSFTAACNETSASLGVIQWNALAQTAIQGMLPSFGGGNSLVNFILELKDFKDVFKFLATGYKRKLDRIRTFSVRDPKTGISKNVMADFDGSKPMEWLSRRYLAYQFGWRPLFQDTVALYESIRDFELRWKEMVRNELEPQQRYWGTTVPGTDSAASTYYSNGVGEGPPGGWYGPTSNLVRCRVVKEASLGVRYHATMRYRYKLPSELFGVGGKLKAFLDLLGVNRNPAILWNAIPFSFIVDWFVNVNKYLERLKVDNIQIQTEILDFCHSARIEKAVMMYLAGSDQFNATVLPRAESVTDTCRKVSYERRTGIPDFRAAILTSGLSLREFSLAGALMGAKKGY